MAVLHPLRLKLLEALGEPLGAAGLARRLGLPRQKLRYHLRRLEAAGVIEPAGTRRARGCTERLLRRRSRRLLVDPYLLDDTARRAPRKIDPRSWTYLRSRAVRLLRDLETAADGSTGRPLALETPVRFPDGRARERFEQELGEAFRALASRYGGGAHRCRYLLVGWPESAPPRGRKADERAH